MKTGNTVIDHVNIKDIKVYSDIAGGVVTE